MRDEVELTAGTIRYEDTGGEGPPIVFIHGLLVDGTLWSDVVAALPGRRCIVPDLPLGAHRVALRPGTDLSPPGLARIVADFLAALDLEDVTLVGNDTGGAICQLVVTAHPERIGALVLTPCDAYDNFLPPFFGPIVFIGGHVPGAIAVLSRVLSVKPLARTPLGLGWLAKRGLTDERIERWTEPARGDAAVRRDLKQVLRGVDKRYTLDAAARFGRFDKPVLLVTAPEDHFFPVAHAERMAATFPDARVELVEDSLTFVPLDQPGRLAALIDGFVRPPSPGRAPSPASPAPR